MAKREELVKAAQAKWDREQLEAAAHAKWAQENEAAPESGENFIDKAAGAARSALAGATFHLSEPVFSGAMAAEQVAKKYITGSGSPKELLDKLASDQLVSDLRAEYAADVQRRRQFRADHPTLDTTAEMTGAVAPLVLTDGLAAPGVLGQAGRALNVGNRAMEATSAGVSAALRGSKAGRAALEAEGLVGAGARVAEGAAQGSAQALGMESVKRATEDATGFSQPGDHRPGLTEVALGGAALGGALPAVGEAASALVGGAKKAATVAGGVSKENIDAYLANPERTRSAKTVEQIKDELDATMGKLREDFEGAKLGHVEAKEAVRAAQAEVNDLVKQNKFLHASEKAEARAQLRAATDDLNQAFKVETSKIKDARMPVQADDVLDSVEQVKQQVTDLSKESYKILDLHEGTFSLDGVAKQVGQLQGRLKVGGQLLSSDSEGAHSVLGQWREKLQAIQQDSGGKLAGGEVKRIIQELDSDIRSAGDRLAGEFSDKTYNALMGVRRALDEKLKTQVAGYAEVMGETARMNELRAQFSKMFGKRESVIAKLSQIAGPNREFERQALAELGQHTGKDFTTPLEEYMQLKNRARTPIAQEDLRRSLPENAALVDATAQNARLNRPEALEAIVNKARTASPEAQALREAEGALGARAGEVAAAQQALEPFKRITPQNSENVIRTLLGGDRQRKIELKRMVAGLGQVSDENFLQMVNDLRTKEAFEGRYQNGSANVNMWATLLGAATGIGSGMDPTLGLAGAGVGAGLGRFMDHYGPALTKRVLDGIIFMRGIPTVQKVSSTFGGLPPGLVEDLRGQLVRLVTIGSTSASVNVPVDQRAEVAKDFLNAEGLSSVEKAAAISSMNKTGAVDSKLVNKLVLGGQVPDPAAERHLHQPQPRRAPTLEQVTDFARVRKPERY